MKVLDLFCGAGGAAEGMLSLGWDVYGVDIADQPRYPGKFLQMDALEALKLPESREWDFVWASPPCQAHSSASDVRNRSRYACFIDATRESLNRRQVLYVIENVMPAPLIPEKSFRLCGAMFGLQVIRHRKFETNCGWIRAAVPEHPPHQGTTITGEYVTVAGNGVQKWTIDQRRMRGLPGVFPGETTTRRWAEALGIQRKNLTRKELAQAIPPAYARWIGQQLL